MGKAQPSSYYDHLFANVIASGKPWRYIHQWAAMRCSHADSVLDLGCGPGWLAKALATHPTLTRYLGVDFSPVAIQQAMTCAPPWAAYMVGTLPDVVPTLNDAANPFDVVVMTEVLEHLEHDRETIAALRPHQAIVATVPTFDDPGHVRVFESAKAIDERYGDLVWFTDIEQIDDRRFGFFGYRKYTGAA